MKVYLTAVKDNHNKAQLSIIKLNWLKQLTRKSEKVTVQSKILPMFE